MSRRALLVANDSYLDRDLKGLISPESDAIELKEVLQDREIGAFDHVEILVNESKFTVEQKIEQLFEDARPDDLLLLYFSGHGVRGKRGRLHFAVSNTKVKANLAATSVSETFVKDCISDSDAGSTVVLLDCCYSGLFSENGVKSPPQIDVGAKLNAGSGVYVLTATDSVEEASDGELDDDGTAGQSLFTATLVRGLRTGRADVRSVGRITPDDLAKYVTSEVPKRTDRQTPTQFGWLEQEIELARVRSNAPQFHQDTGTRLCLGDLIGELSTTSDHGLRATQWQGSGDLIVPIGQVVAHGDRGETMRLSLGRGGGHLLVVGKMGTGKSTLLRTLACSLALTHSPHELRLDFLESGANKLGSLQRLPHVRGVAGDDDPESALRVLDQAEQLIKERKRLFREHGLVSAEHFRNHRAALPQGPHPDLVVFIDQWTDFTGAVSKFSSKVENLANLGREFGVHLAVATRRPDDLPRALRELFSSYVELNLPDPRDSLIDADLSRRLPESEPGWALTGRLRFRVAQAYLSSETPEDEDPFTDGASEIVAKIFEEWKAIGPTLPGSVPYEIDVNRLHPRLYRRHPEDPLAEHIDLARVLGFDVEEFRPETRWQLGNEWEFMRAPIGVREDGRRLALDLKEASQGGIGPHGLLIGATGSGKSEVLRTLVASLAANHSSEALNFVLVDFKGGATFHSLERLPHVSAVVTNLGDEIELVDRMTDALTGELVRRQELLRSAGNFKDRRDYEAARTSGASLEPLPALMIVVDEFSELLTAKPDFINLFIQIGRIGRSVGIHMVLASQRLEEGRLRGLDSYLSYRIALRTFSAGESRTVLGSSVAYELPQQPGHGYLLTGNHDLVRFRAAYSGTEIQEGRTELEELVSRTVGAGVPAHQVWLPPLDEPATLDQLLPLTVDPASGFIEYSTDRDSSLRAVIGEEDRPFEQQRASFEVDLAGGLGNVAIAGAAQSGKSMMLRTMIGSLALSYTPREVQFFCLDFGGGTLRGFEDLPHVAGVFGRRDAEGVRRTVQEVAAILDEREAFFTANKIDGMDTYRHDKARSHFQGDLYGDIFLVVDNWMTLREQYEPLIERIQSIGHRGLAYGVHVIATCNRWGDVRMNMRDMFGLKLELRLSDPAESEIDRRIAANVPLGRAGRGLTPGGSHFQAGLPRVDGLQGVDDLSSGVEDLVAKVNGAWRADPCPPVRLLPRRLPVSEFLRAVDRSKPGIPIGLDEAGLRPVHLDFSADPHLLVLGDGECGKTNLLRHIARQIQETYSEDEAKIIMADYRRGMLEEVSKPVLLDYAMSGTQFENSCKNLRGPMERRLPSEDVSPAQLRDRSWWTGPDLYLIVDDYEMVAQRHLNPMTQLSELISQGRDIGFHVIIARRSTGAGRSMMDPVMGQIKQMENPGLLMSGRKEEGKLFGDLRPSPQPPGRGTLVRRREGAQLIQTPLLPPNGAAE